jgi:DNA polymerase III alpha subunit
MNSNIYGEVILSIDDAIHALYSGRIQDLSSVLIENDPRIPQFNQAVKNNLDDFGIITPYRDPGISVQEYDQNLQKNWFIPEEYKDFDIVNWLFDQCTSQEQRDRVAEEIELFVQLNMYDMLVYLKYLVDIMRSNNVVWGVGRGSSVASYCLYLLGVHKIDSIRYELDIKEFLK